MQDFIESLCGTQMLAALTVSVMSQLNTSLSVFLLLYFTKTKFTQMRKVFTSRKISLATKLRLVKCYVYSSLLYCCETWTLYLNDIQFNSIQWFFIRLKSTWTFIYHKTYNSYNTKKRRYKLTTPPWINKSQNYIPVYPISIYQKNSETALKILP